MSALEQLVQRFVDRTLPKAEWTHEAHLRVGTWHVHQHGLDQAMVLLRERIPRYNESVGGVNTDTDGYHDTITWCYLVMIDDLRRREGAGLTVEELADLVAVRLEDRKLPFTYYSKDHLMSVPARRGIVEPDLLPLPVHGSLPRFGSADPLTRCVVTRWSCGPEGFRRQVQEQAPLRLGEQAER